jgi:hypothetical protein
MKGSSMHTTLEDRMNEKAKRANRRAQRERIKNKVIRLIRDIWRAPDIVKDEGYVGSLVNHGAQICSCPMCGNPRRHFGEKTPQEKRHEI